MITLWLWRCFWCLVFLDHWRKQIVCRLINLLKSIWIYKETIHLIGILNHRTLNMEAQNTILACLLCISQTLPSVHLVDKTINLVELLGNVRLRFSFKVCRYCLWALWERINRIFLITANITILLRGGFWKLSQNSLACVAASVWSKIMLKDINFSPALLETFKSLRSLN